jgi:hypothetical protein
VPEYRLRIESVLTKTYVVEADTEDLAIEEIVTRIEDENPELEVTDVYVLQVHDKENHE